MSAIVCASVALLAEGVDRNYLFFQPPALRAAVALLAEAWIEISRSGGVWRGPSVALLAEGVDRNSFRAGGAAAAGESPSSRRAWIEIYLQNT